MSASCRALSLVGWLAVVVIAACGRLSGIDDKVLVGSVVPSASVDGIPPRPAIGPGDGSGETLGFAARRVWLGGLDPASGKPAPGAWRRMGFNLDGERTSLQQSADGSSSCKRAPMSELSVQEDGDDGRDNAFGSQLLPLLPLIHPSFSGLEARLNESIEQVGWPAPMVTINDLDRGANDGQVYLGVFLVEVEGPADSRWENMTRVVYDIRSTLGGTPTSRFSFSRGYTNNNTLVSGDFDENFEAAMLLPFEPATDALVVHPRKIVLTLEMDASHRRIKSSTIAGVLDVDDLTAAMLPIVRNSGAYCGAPGEEKLRGLIARAADLRVGSEGALERDPGAPCNAISFGFLLEWEPSKFPKEQEYRYAPQLKDACPEE